MIKSDFGTVIVHGAYPIICADFIAIIMALKNGGFSDDEIDCCVERAKKPRKERAAENKKRMEDVLKPMFGGSDDKPKKSGKAVVVSVDADTPAEDVGKKIAEIVAKTLREMKEE